MHHTIAKLIGSIALALAGTALAADPWMVRDIARDTGLSTAQVYHVIGANYATVEHVYFMHPSQRGYIQQVVRDYSERGLTMEPGLRLDRARRIAAQAR
jgi:hypothetical protein